MKNAQDAWNKFWVNDIKGLLGVPDGQFKQTSEKAFVSGWNAALDSLPKKRSNQQNRYYFGCVVKIMSEFSGYTPAEVHVLNKTTLPFPHRRELPSKTKFTLFKLEQYQDAFISSTKNMTSKEFMDWIELTI